MRWIGCGLVPVMVVLLVAPPVSAAQSQADIWRDFAKTVDVGTELTVQLQDGQRFRATLVGVRADDLLLQPSTRVPVPVQPVPYDAILSLARRPKGGVGAGKAAAIGVATGAATFFVILLAMLGTID